MYIDICIPFEPDKRLGYAYNRFAASSKADWILFLDYDVLLLNQKFYEICLSAIASISPNLNPGWITCTTNRLGPLTKIHQLDLSSPRSDDIVEHTVYSEQRYSRYGNLAVDITELSKRVLLSGFFILTPRLVALDIGFKDGFLGIDNEYCKDLLKAGYTTWSIPGLYCYHRYKREWRQK